MKDHSSRFNKDIRKLIFNGQVTEAKYQLKFSKITNKLLEMRLHWIDGDFQHCDEILTELIEEFEDISEFPLLEFEYYIFQTNLYWRLGKLEQANTKNIHLQQLYTQIEHDYDRTKHIWELFGEYYNLQGILNAMSEESLTKSVELFKQGIYAYDQADCGMGLSQSYNNLGEAYRLLENYKQALEYYNKAIASNPYQPTSTVDQTNIAYTLYAMGQIAEAKKAFEVALEFEYHDPIILSTIYLGLLLCNVDLEHTDLASDYMNMLDNLDHETYEQIRYDIAFGKAYLLKSPNTPKSRWKAEEYLDEIITSTSVERELKIRAIKLKIKLLFMDHDQSNDDPTIKEIETLTLELQAHASTNSAYSTLAETYVFQSKLDFLEGRYLDAEKRLRQSLIFVDELDLEYLHEWLVDEMKKFEANKKQIEKSSFENQDTQSLIEFGNLIQEFFTINPQDLENAVIEENPVLLLIINSVGQTIISLRFQDDEHLQEYLISNFLSAFQSMTNETFNSTGFIKKIKHETYDIALHHMSNFIFCYVYTGSSFKASIKLKKIMGDRTIKKIIDKLDPEITSVTGNTQQILSSKITELIQK